MSFRSDCRRCSRLTRYTERLAAEYPEYYNAPVGPFGDPDSPLLIVGLAPGLHGANATGRAFTGDESGRLLYETLFRHGFCSKPQSSVDDADFALIDCRITNAVKCVPPQNRPTTREIQTCNVWLKGEIDAAPSQGVVLALGKIAHDAVLRALSCKLAHFPFAHGAIHQLPGDRTLLDSYHCSRYNTQTGRLTPAMFAEIFRTVKGLLASRRADV